MRAEILSDRGSGPCVAFIPGMDGTGELLLDTAGRLEEHFRLLRFHYVDESAPGSAATYERLADTAARALLDAGVDRALILAESFGGGVALQLGLRHAERVQALALVNTFAWYPRRARLSLGATLLPFVPQALLHFCRRRFAGQIFFRPRRVPEIEAAFGRIVPGFAGPGFAARMNAMRQLDLRDRLAEIGAPCQLYASTHDRVVPSTRTMATLAAGLPNARLELLYGFNHLVLPFSDEPWPERLTALERSTRDRSQ